MPRRAGDSKQRLISRIVTQAQKKAKPEEEAYIEEFVRQYYRNVSSDDLMERRPADLAGAALQHLRFGASRQAGTPKLQIFNPTTRKHGWRSTHTIVQMVNDDMPFLVDSLGIALSRFGLNIHLTVHPVLFVRRDAQGRLMEVIPRNEAADDASAESFMHVEVDRETDKAVLEEALDAVRLSMGDVRASVDDWRSMRQRTLEICDRLSAEPPPLPESEIGEGKAFLEWMEMGHFTYLGYREYRLIRRSRKYLLEAVPDSGLGILRNPSGENQNAPVELPKHASERAREKELLIVTKANSVATVHRPGYMDYVGVKTFDESGEVVGERRFLGLFTSVAYNRSPREIPLLRHKVETVMELSGLLPNSHAGKALLHILETFPRDELFQSSVDELHDIATGILELQERQRVKLFLRRDAFGRFFSCLVFVPRDKYNTGIRERIQQILMKALHGRSVESNVQLSESVLARVHITVRTTPWKFREVDVSAIEHEIAQAVRSWNDVLRDSLVERFGEERGLKLFRRFGRAFPAAYIEDVSAKAAVFDVAKMDALGTGEDEIQMSLYRPSSYPEHNLRFKLFRPEQPIPISDVLPMLENMGLRVISEQPYKVELGDDSIIWVQDFEMVHDMDEGLDPEAVSDIFQHCFEQAWRGRAENDAFNRLVLGGQLTWRQVMLLRAICKYLLQAGVPFSQAYQEEALYANRGIARALVDYLETRFDPRLRKKARRERTETIRSGIVEALDGVQSQDQDRILRGFLSVIDATLRTNYYQLDEEGRLKSYLSLKLDPHKIPELPLPRPMYEIWVYSPRVEAVHLRGGKVARGGLRWSDRREDFRTEVLGLMKAQMVKNAVIVPVGSKGGFVVKKLPTGGDRDQVMAEVQECYRSFIRGMLDITDNLDGDRVVPPRDVVRHDDDDPYLVVAADKGTATFSDLANSVSAEYGFWLGDAFASGGSVGYDHKKMGITAKGAWESVRRHFREMGVDTQTRDFTVAGIGDMAGDVFGNGMLLSKHIRLQAAFNHMHIFLDPDPDAASSWEERKRLFELPRSTWEDYDQELISEGGGIHSRFAKTIKLTPQVRKMLDVEATSMTPQELIRAIMRMPVDLIWNGGIGTYVKASDESDAEVGDRANDAVRVDADQVRARVIGEGGNLGLTQLARIEYAANGGRCNTDFIDNSGGVDCSDREVNIKILLNVVAQHRKISEKQRTKLLTEMTDEVTRLVLRDNYLQSQALSMTETQSKDRLNEYAHLISVLERNGELNRGLEYLPAEEEIAERGKSELGLTRPELSVLLSYSKINLYKQLVESDVPEDVYLQEELIRYFPEPLQRRYEDLMHMHRLRREIVVTAITNSMTNRMGPTFSYRMQEETSAGAAAVARAYTIAREAFDMRELWTDIEHLDNDVPSSVQYSMFVQSSRLVKHATRWLLGRPGRSLDIARGVEDFQSGLRELRDGLPGLLTQREANRYQATAEQFTDIGVPAEVAGRIAALNTMYAGLDIVEASKLSRASVDHVARVYFHLGQELALDWIRDQVEHLPVAGHWQAVARGTLRENLYSLHRTLAANVLRGHRKSDPDQAVSRWLGRYPRIVEHARQTLTDMGAMDALDFPTLSVALQEIRKLTLVEPDETE